MNIDPLADDPAQLDQSPYQFSWNNPILLNDPSGECPDCPNGGQEGDVHTSTNVLPFNAPNGQMLSGTDGEGLSFFSDPLASVTWANLGEDNWQALGFETKGGARYAWDTDNLNPVLKNG